MTMHERHPRVMAEYNFLVDSLTYHAGGADRPEVECLTTQIGQKL